MRKADIVERAANVVDVHGVRASVHEIAKACGIAPSSLYHHFPSKEAILEAILQRYLDELNEIALAATTAPVVVTGQVEPVFDLSVQIAETASRNRTGVLLSMYGALGAESAEVSTPVPPAVLRAMMSSLGDEQAKRGGRSDLPVELVADMLCQGMLHVGLGLFPNLLEPREIATARCHMLLDGIAQHCPSDANLDASPAMSMARQVIAEWEESTEDDLDEASALFRAAAQSEIARRGYQATTIRDIASAAGLSSHSAIFRRFRTKDQLLASITDSFSDKVSRAWRAVLQTESTDLEKLDALIWTDVSLIERYRDEFNALQAYLRESPPSGRGGSWRYPARLRDLQALVDSALENGLFRPTEGAPTSRRYAEALADFLWIPDNLLAQVGGARSALIFLRRCALRGALGSRHSGS